MKRTHLYLGILCASLSPAIYGTTYFSNTGTASCAGTDGEVGTYTCGTGAAQTVADAAINGFGFFISSSFQQFASGANGAAPLGAIVDGSHDPATTPLDTASGCNTAVPTQHCATLTFTDTGSTSHPITSNSTISFSWSNINLSLVSFGGPNGSYLDQYYVEYILKDSGGNTVLDWNSDPSNALNWTSGATSVSGLSGSGSTAMPSTLNGNYTVEAVLHVGWLWLGPQTGTPAAAGAQGPGVDLDMSIGTGSLDIGVGAFSVPEPSTIGIAGLGLALVGAGMLRKRRAVNGR